MVRPSWDIEQALVSMEYASGYLASWSIGFKVAAIKVRPTSDDYHYATDRP